MDEVWTFRSEEQACPNSSTAPSAVRKSSSRAAARRSRSWCLCSLLGTRKRHAGAVEGIRELAKQMNLGPFDWEEWKRYRQMMKVGNEPRPRWLGHGRVVDPRRAHCAVSTGP